MKQRCESYEWCRGHATKLAAVATAVMTAFALALMGASLLGSPMAFGATASPYEYDTSECPKAKNASSPFVKQKVSYTKTYSGTSGGGSSSSSSSQTTSRNDGNEMSWYSDGDAVKL